MLICPEILKMQTSVYRPYRRRKAMRFDAGARLRLAIPRLQHRGLHLAYTAAASLSLSYPLSSVRWRAQKCYRASLFTRAVMLECRRCASSRQDCSLTRIYRRRPLGPWKKARRCCRRLLSFESPDWRSSTRVYVYRVCKPYLNAKWQRWQQNTPDSNVNSRSKCDGSLPL